MITAAVIGVGIGEQHIQAYNQAGIPVTHLCDFDPSLDFEKDWRQVVGKTDHLSVASWDQYHAEQVIAGLEADQHVFCEKPLCLTFDELAAIKKALAHSKGSLGVNYPLRYFGQFRLMKAAVQEATSAGSTVTHWAMDYRWGRAHKWAGWRGTCPNYTIATGAGSHLIDLALWMGLKVGDLTDARLRDDGRRAANFYFGPNVVLIDCAKDDGLHWRGATIFFDRHGQTSCTISLPSDKQAALLDFLDRPYRDKDDEARILEGTEICLKMAALL